MKTIKNSKEENNNIHKLTEDELIDILFRAFYSTRKEIRSRMLKAEKYRND
ncbi:MAG: hypothetical protein ACLFSQ_06820 [Candidatus Zixiibacteriota bacterium]